MSISPVSTSFNTGEMPKIKIKKPFIPYSNEALLKKAQDITDAFTKEQTGAKAAINNVDFNVGEMPKIKIKKPFIPYSKEHVINTGNAILEDMGIPVPNQAKNKGLLQKAKDFIGEHKKAAIVLAGAIGVTAAIAIGKKIIDNAKAKKEEQNNI